MVKLDAPSWLRDGILAARPENGPSYRFCVQQGFLEVPDWAYHLRDAGHRLIEVQPDFELLFNAVFEAAMPPPADGGIRIVGGARTEHYILIAGFALAPLLSRLNLAEKYVWQPDPET